MFSVTVTETVGSLRAWKAQIGVSTKTFGEKPLAGAIPQIGIAAANVFGYRLNMFQVPPPPFDRPVTYARLRSTFCCASARPNMVITLDVKPVEFQLLVDCGA